METNFKDLWNDQNFISDEQKARINLEVEFIGKIIEAREQKGITQRHLAELTGIKQSAIARLEKNSSSPQIDTLLKILKPLGYKLAIVPDIDEAIYKKNKNGVKP